MSEVTQHPIAGFGEHLLPRDLSLIDEAFNALLNAGKEYLDGHATAVHEAGKLKGNRDYTREAIARKQHDLLGKNSPGKLQTALQAIIRTTAAMRTKIQADARPKGPESDTRALLEYMQRRDLLADLRELTGEERVKLLTRTTQRGDRSVLDALQSSLKPLVAPQMLEAAEEYYIGATQREALGNLETQEEIERAAKLAVRQIMGKAEGMVKEAEVKGDLLHKPPNMQTASPVAHLSDSEKARLIGEIGGHEAYREILAGTRELPPAFWNDEAKISFIEKHGAENFEKFTRGEWQPPE